MCAKLNFSGTFVRLEFRVSHNSVVENLFSWNTMPRSCVMGFSDVSEVRSVTYKGAEVRENLRHLVS